MADFLPSIVADKPSPFEVNVHRWSTAEAVEAARIRDVIVSSHRITVFSRENKSGPEHKRRWQSFQPAVDCLGLIPTSTQYPHDSHHHDEGKMG